MAMGKFVEWWQRQVRSVGGLTFLRARAPLSGGQRLHTGHRLIRLLELAASYNDKGIHWRNDSPTRVQQTRQKWQREIEALIGSLDESVLPAELLAALRSGAAVRDDSGRYVEQARSWMSAGRS